LKFKKIKVEQNKQKTKDMRKILATLALVTFSVLLIAPAVLAQTAPPSVTQCSMRHILNGFTGFTCPQSATAPANACPFDSTTYTCGACCMLDTVYTVTDWIFYLVFAVSIVFIIMGAFTIVTAGGSPEKVTSGRNYILYAVIGVLIGLAAKGIPAIARAIIGV
jgi:hypothetical protein